MEIDVNWSVDGAMRQMWSEMDKNVSNGEMMEFFKRHLQGAFDEGFKRGYSAAEHGVEI